MLAALKPTAIETHSSLVTEVEVGYTVPIAPAALNSEVQSAKPATQKNKPVELPKATNTKDSVLTDVPKVDLPEAKTLDDSPQVGPEDRAPKTATNGRKEQPESPELLKSEPKKAFKGEVSSDVPTKLTQPDFNRFQVALSTDKPSTENPLQVEPSRESLPESKLVEVVRQVSDKVRLLAAARPKSGVTIHLDPEEFGSITVVVRSIGRMVDASLSVSDDRVREALDRHQGRLVEAMDNHGFVLQNVLVNSQPSGGFQPGSRGGQGSPSDQPRHFGQSPSHGRGDRPFNPPKSNIRAWVRRGEGVDISI
jgi:flagellar hook-length control protein FliK